MVSEPIVNPTDSRAAELGHDQELRDSTAGPLQTFLVVNISSRVRVAVLWFQRELQQKRGLQTQKGSTGHFAPPGNSNTHLRKKATVSPSEVPRLDESRDGHDGVPARGGPDSRLVGEELHLRARAHLHGDRLWVGQVGLECAMRRWSGRKESKNMLEGVWSLKHLFGFHICPHVNWNV